VTEHYVVPRERHGIELDELLCLHYPLLTKGFIRRQVRAGKVLVDGERSLPSTHLRTDQVVSIDIDEDSGDLPKPPVAPCLALDVLYEDDEVLAIDKPAGLPVEPERWARGNACLSGALLELALQRAESTAAEGEDTPEGLGFRPRLVHRIDKGTSGVVLVAKTLSAERRLREAFAAGDVRKAYLALVEGEYPLDDGETETIDLSIGPDRRKSGRMQVLEKNGKPSRTRVGIESRYHGYTLLRCEPLSGRTHQIRVHLSASGFPLAVDDVYGRRSSLALSEIKSNYRPKRGGHEAPLIDRLTLHALELGFPDGEDRTRFVEAPPPKDYQRVLKQLAKVRPYRRR